MNRNHFPAMGAAFRFYWVVAASGGVLMALEMLSSRILSPWFGSSVYVWGSVISVFLAALSLGYVWGGRLADREPTMPALGRLLIGAGAWIGVLLVAATPMVSVIGEATQGSRAGALLAAALLFGPASLLLATASPYAVRLAARDLTHLGDTAGRLYALSTAGSLAGTLSCTFVFIPFLRLPQILGLLVAVTAITGAMALKGKLATELPATGAAIALVLLAVPKVLLPERLATGLLHQQITPYQTLEVREAAGTRYLLSDGVLHGGLELATGEAALRYPRSFAGVLLFKPEIERLLVLGMGTASIGSHLRQQLPGLRVDYAEIDPAVPDIARRFLGFRDHPAVAIHVDDGRRFLARSQGKWDFIVADTYIGLSVPFHLTTREFLQQVRDHLTPGGVFGLNLAASLERPFPRAVLRTVIAEFEGVSAFSVPGSGNIMILATAAGPHPPREVLIQRGHDLDRSFRLEPSLAAIARARLSAALDLPGVPLLTDDFAPVERLVQLDAP